MATTELIKAASIARVTSKAGKFLGFLVKSNHTEDYYRVTCLKIDGACTFFCTCKAAEFGNSNCCHVKAVKELVAARKELQAEIQEKHEAAIKKALAMRLTAQSIADDRRNGNRRAIEALKEDIRTIEMRGCLFDEKGYEIHNWPELTGVKLVRKVKEVACKRAPQFAGMELSKRGFVVQQVSELGGRAVPMKTAA